MAKNILLIEDSDVDAFIADSYFKRCELECKITRVINGQQAIEFLEDNPDSSHLDLILLDLNLPIIGGKEVLRRIREMDHTRETPVVVLSSSSNPDDRDECSRYTSEYLEKPFDEEKTARILGIAV